MPWKTYFRAGLTGEIRDAKIELTGSGLQNTKANTGFVPLLYGGVAIRF